MGGRLLVWRKVGSRLDSSLGIGSNFIRRNGCISFRGIMIYVSIGRSI